MLETLIGGAAVLAFVGAWICSHHSKLHEATSPVEPDEDLEDLEDESFDSGPVQYVTLH